MDSVKHKIHNCRSFPLFLVRKRAETWRDGQENSPSDGHVCGAYLCASPQTSFLCQDKQLGVNETIKAVNCSNE